MKVLLLDIENQSKKIKELCQLLNEYDRVFVVYATSPTAITLDDLPTLTLAIQSERLSLLKMPHVGSNAADFGLTFVAGMLTQQLNKDACIDVMSNDRDLHYAVELLRLQGFQSHHIRHKEVPKVVVNTVEQAQLNLIQKESPSTQKAILPTVQVKILKLLQKNQPKKFVALQHSLMSWLNMKPEKANQYIEWLKQQDVIRLSPNATGFLYSQDKLQQQLKLATLQVNKAQENTSDLLISKPHLQPLQQYCSYLEKIKQNKPQKITALRNSLKAVLKYEKDSQVDIQLNLLKKYHVLCVDEMQVNYDEKYIEHWANLA